MFISFEHVAPSVDIHKKCEQNQVKASNIHALNSELYTSVHYYSARMSFFIISCTLRATPPTSLNKQIDYTNKTLIIN